METNSSRSGRQVRRLICAMGGEGGGVLTSWIVDDVARHLGSRRSYDDVVQVARHKARVERFLRIEGELGGKDQPPAP